MIRALDHGGPLRFDVVVLTDDQSSGGLFDALTEELAGTALGRPSALIAVDDRPVGAISLGLSSDGGLRMIVVPSGGRNAAASRNRGWSRSSSAWVCFPGDAVASRSGWGAHLVADMESAGERVAVAVVAGRDAVDLAVRRTALAEIGGFDERIAGDSESMADLVRRLVAAGWEVAGQGTDAPRLQPDATDPVPAGERWETRRPRAVLFDRDGTLVDELPATAFDEELVTVHGAQEALDQLRAEGIAVGLVSRHRRAAGDRIAGVDVEAVTERVIELLGPFDTVQCCLHGAEEQCGCLEPTGRMLLAASEDLGIDLVDCAVVGDTGVDVAAGLAAGARAVIVPTAVTEAEEVAEAPEVAGSVTEAVDALLRGVRLPAGHQLAPTARQATVLREWAT